MNGTEERQGYRNGSRPAPVDDPLALSPCSRRESPEVRDGTFSTDLFWCATSAVKQAAALRFFLLEMVVNGVSTRKVTRITEELCGTSVSKSTVSALCSRRILW